MRKVHAYLVGGSLIISSVLISQGCTKSTESDDDLIGNWQKSNDFGGDPRSEAVCFTIGENAYVTTGASSSTRYKDIWEYNTSRKYWTQMADMPGVARNAAVAFSIGTKGYVGTGFDGINALNDFYEFDPAAVAPAAQWTRKADFTGEARYRAVGFAVNNKGYIATGYTGTKSLNNMYQYDPASDTWTGKASVSGSKRAGAMSFVIGGKAYICSGSDNNGEIQQDLQMYDPGTDSWTEKTKIYNYSSDTYDDDYGSIPRQNGVAFVMGNYVYITGGDNISVVSTTWQYDPSIDRWAAKTAFEGKERTGAVAFTLDNRGFVLTGRSGSSTYDNMYEFFPNADKVDGD